MPGNCDLWSNCVLCEHLPLHEVIVSTLDLHQPLGAFNHFIYAELQPVIGMIVAPPHTPCMFKQNGELPQHLTTVEGALYLFQMEHNSSMQNLNDVIQYIFDIGQSDILEMQLIYQ